jgi:hypothetical protein
MIDDSGPDAAKALWRSRIEEWPPINRKLLQHRVTQLRYVERKEAVWGYIAFAVLTGWVAWMFIAPPIFKTPLFAAWAPRTIAALLFVGAVYSAIRWHLNHYYRVFFTSGDEQSGLLAYRTELQRLRAIHRTYLRQSVMPLIPAFITWLVSWVAAPQYIFPGRAWWPLLGIFFGGSIAAAFGWRVWMSRRDVKRIEQELKELESLRGS